MAGYAAATVVALKALQLVLTSLEAYLALGGVFCPISSPIDTITSTSTYDYIVVGAGEAGSVVAHRLATETNKSILVLEEGGCPPLESLFAGMFTTQPLSSFDRAMNIYNDGYANQNLKPDGGFTAGKMWGGTSALNHLLYVTPFPSDYDAWAAAAEDPSWGFPDFAYYFAKGENVKDPDVLAQNTSLHGTTGPTLLKRQKSPMTAPIIAAYEELGLSYKNDSYGQCTNEPLLTIGDDGIWGNIRQSGSTSYLRKIKNQNVHFLTGAVVTKVLFDGTTATGVQFTHKGSSYSVFASSKVIVSAGAIKSPQLLILSGIGDLKVLNGLGITPIVNNKEVGQNLKDHVTACFSIALNKDLPSTAPVNFQNWPAPMVTAYTALTPEETVITRQDIVLYFTTSSSGFLQLCTYVFKYKDAICDAWYEYNTNRNILFIAPSYLHSLSTGSITPETTDINDQPIIKLNHLSNSEDLEKFAALLMASAQIVNTTALQNLGAEIADVGVCSNYPKYTFDYWKCYALAMSSTRSSTSGTCMLGKVVDKSLNVIGTSNLKVIDASIFPSLPSGNPASTVRALAEKGSDIIINEDLM